MDFQLVVGVSARHLHLCAEDLKILFGENATLHNKKDITQPGQFAADEQVMLVTDKTKMKFRVIGPVRPETQIEISLTDARTIGIKAPIRNSGDLEGTNCEATLIGPCGEVKLTRGIIVAARHIHVCPATATQYGLQDGDIVDVQTSGVRALTLHNVLVRAGEKHQDECHIDTDEANACCLNTGDYVTIIKK